MTTEPGKGAPASGDAAGGERVSPAATARPAAARKPPKKPAAGWVFAPAVGAFLAALALLAFQVRAGQDPALGPAEPVAQAQPSKPRQVLIRKVIKRVVVHHPPATSGGAARTSAPASSTSAPAPAAAPASAPAPAAAPTSAPAAAPAPAPAPLTTQSS